MKVLEVVRLKKEAPEGLKFFMVLKYGCYTDKQSGGVCVAGLRTAQRVKSKSEIDLVAKLNLSHDIRLIEGTVNFPADSHGMRQRGESVRVTGDLNPLLLELED